MRISYNRFSRFLKQKNKSVFPLDSVERLQLVHTIQLAKIHPVVRTLVTDPNLYENKTKNLPQNKELNNTAKQQASKQPNLKENKR